MARKQPKPRKSKSWGPSQRRKNTTKPRADHRLPSADEQVDSPGSWVCQCCGQPMVAQGFVPKGEGSGRRGRARKYDIDACRECMAAWSTFSEHMQVVRDRATPQAWLWWRQTLMGLANSRAWNRGVANTLFQERRQQVERPEIGRLQERVARAEAAVTALQTRAALSAYDIASEYDEYAPFAAHARGRLVPELTRRGYSPERAADYIAGMHERAVAELAALPHKIAGAKATLTTAKRELNKVLKA